MLFRRQIWSSSFLTHMQKGDKLIASSFSIFGIPSIQRLWHLYWSMPMIKGMVKTMIWLLIIQSIWLKNGLISFQECFSAVNKEAAWATCWRRRVRRWRNKSPGRLMSHLTSWRSSKLRVAWWSMYQCHRSTLKTRAFSHPQQRSSHRWSTHSKKINEVWID